MTRLKLILSLICFLFSVSSGQAQIANEINELNTLFEASIYTNFNTAQKTASRAVMKSEILQDEYLMLESYSNLSLIYYRQKKNDSSLIYTQKALGLSNRLNDFKKQAVLNNRVAALEKRKGNYSIALEYFQKAYKIADKGNYVEQICDIHNNLASLYRIRGDRKKFKEELEMAIEMAKKNDLKNSLARSYNIKGISLYKKQKDSAIYYYKEAIKLFRAVNNKHFVGLVYANLGDIYINTGEHKKALECLELSESIAIEVNNMASLYFINISLGIYNIEIENYNECVLKYEKAINQYGKYVDNSKLVRGYWLLSEGYYFNGQFKKAFDAQEKYIDLNEDIVNAKKAKEFDELRTKYDVEKKDDQIALLEKESELDDARRQRIILIGLLLVTALSLLLLYYRNRIKTQKIIRQKEKERLIKEQEIVQVKALIEGQDKERHRLAKELHDGLGGQLANANLTLSQANSEMQNSEINSVSEKLSDIFNDLRILSHNLSSNYFNEKTFDELLLELKQQYKSSKTFNIIVSIFPEKSLDDLNTDIKHNLYRILQELFNNSFKHANCNNVELSINRHHNEIVVMYEDDGIGFNTKTQREGIGLSNINERAESINGHLVIDSQPGKGTQIMLQIPI